MRVYSDILTRSDLTAACNRPVFYVDELMTIQRPRVRACGWQVRLAGSGRRRRNSGVSGSESTPAATYDQHGEWMARLFAIDPKARIACYDGVADFIQKTAGKYPVTTEDAS